MSDNDATPARGMSNADALAFRETIDTLIAERDALAADVARLRKRTHEIQERADKELAKVKDLPYRVIHEMYSDMRKERDALAQLVRVLEAGPDDAACDRVIKMVSGGGMWALINNETKREYLRAALTPEAK